MKTSHILLLCSLFAIVLSSRLDINSAECNKYLQKFGTANASNGVGPTSLAYAGDAAFVEGTANVKVNLRYSDSLYNDATYFGLVQEDGKTAEATCLDLKLWKFTSDSYADPVQVTDLPITNSSNLNKKWRYLSFTINGADLASRTVQSSNTGQYIYTGYYAVAYYAAGTTQVQYTYYFQFSVTVNRSSGAAVSTSFKPLSQFETATCTIGGSCTASSVSALNWCTDATCSNKTVPTLHLNDQFYIQQAITTVGLQNYYLTNTTVQYIGNGLNKQTTPVSIDNSVAGKTLLLLTADIAWNNVSVQVTSYLSTTVDGSRRILVETTTYDPINGNTGTLQCIKLSNSDACATCSEQLQANNGIAEDDCSSFSLLVTMLSLLLLLII